MSRIVYFAFYSVTFLLGTEVLADGYRQGEWSGHMWGSGMIFGPLMMLGFFAILIFGIVLLVKWVMGSNQPSQNTQSSSALDILNERFAKGEIEKEEYEERKSILLS